MTTHAASPDSRVFEMRTYHAAPGKLDALHSRFRDHTLRLFAKHGIASLGYWTPIENPDNLLIFVLAYPGRKARDTRWKAFVEDPEWISAKAASEKDGPLVARVEQRSRTIRCPFSPEPAPRRAFSNFALTPLHPDASMRSMPASAITPPSSSPSMA
jgi:hypothetical protein